MGDAVVGNAGIRGIALLKESGVNERLEQGARLPPGLDGAVQLGFLRVPSADNGQKRSRGIVHHHGRGLDVIGHGGLGLFPLFRGNCLVGGQGRLIFRLGGQLVFNDAALLSSGLEGG